jgi:endonuclease/exonuclease/phosphatase family metal-dependent hydrolase
MSELAVATFNLHAGVNGWGRAFDVVSACADLDADVLVLQETWTPAGGEGLAAAVASSLGYEAHEVALSDAILLEPATAPGRRKWGPYSGDPRHARRLWVADSEDVRRLRRLRWGSAAESGTWGIAVLTRLPVGKVEVIELGRLRRDRSMRRAAILVEVTVGPRLVTVVGTHFAHFTHGSAIQSERLRRRLPARSTPGVLAGDMNFWGPPLSLVLPGWRRAVRARTYPSWRAHSQIDHIFVNRAVEVISGEVLRVGNSDHWPIRARLAVP